MIKDPSHQELQEKIIDLEQQLFACRQHQGILVESEKRYRTIFEQAAVGIVHCNLSGQILSANSGFANFLGYSTEELLNLYIKEITFPEDIAADSQSIGELAAGKATRFAKDKRYVRKDGSVVWGHVTVSVLDDEKGKPMMLLATTQDIHSRKMAEDVIARRVLSLTQPLTGAASVSFEDLFNLDDIQRLQDQFAKATGVASIITRTDGTPITKPSNFTRLCSELIRTSAKGLANCRKSDAALGQLLTTGPIVQPCLSGGLWDAGAGISVGGRHIANWLIGQVRDETQTEEAIRRYGREIGIDEEQIAKAFQEVPAMSRRHFEEISEMLFTLAKRLSATAYRNLQQARFIADLKGTEEKLRHSENRLRFALEGANDGLWDADLKTGTVFFSQRSQEILGHSSDDAANALSDWRSLVHPDDFEKTWALIVAHMKKRTPILRIEHRLHMKNGSWKWVLTRGKVVEWAEDGRALRLTGTLTDINDRKKIEEAQMFLLTCDRTNPGEDFFKLLARFLAELLHMDFVCIDKLEGDNLSARTVAIFHDGQFEDNISYTLEDTPCGKVVGETICTFPSAVRHLFPSDSVLQEIAAESYVGTTLWGSSGTAIGLIAVISRQSLENPTPVESVLKLVGIRAAAELERREAEHETALLQTQLIQAQKMESIGRLAGGVSHDFNNMLGVILGHVEMAEEYVDPASPISIDLREIKKAASRSADLTRQLLAFARKQTVSPKVLDLNEIVESLLKMLRRLIGENIDLTWLPGKNLWPVHIDPSQIDQILANLTINSRDAISGVGRMTIETANMDIDEDYCTNHVGFMPGSYVTLTVSDTGCGMDRETREHIFEPFFTTKEVGQGTGLGLATIYGIVKQNEGFINVYSEPGEGASFRIFFPRYRGESLKIDQYKPLESPEQGRETILLVEDEPSILQLGIRMLERLGYHVLPAPTPNEALKVAERYEGEIHLLLTDVIMPEMNGRTLAKQLRSLHPRMRQMFMSGYTADVIAHHGVLDEGVQFIQKPFTKAELSIKVRQALK
ncbi:MAG: PocR ligand-binding domain-containing protein [Desulforhopalus sp.]|nr:PocR ligand-binding domain-containing protein [Desulforhopalus sp.]